MDFCQRKSPADIGNIVNLHTRKGVQFIDIFCYVTVYMRVLRNIKKSFLEDFQWYRFK